MIGKTALRFSVVAAFAFAVSACGAPSITDIGTPSSGDDSSTVTPTPPPGASPSYALQLDSATSDIDLKATKDVTFTVTGFNGFSGTINVSVSGLPVGITASPATQGVNIAVANGTAAGKVTLTSDNKTVLPGSSSFAVDSVSGALTDTDAVALTVNPVITLQTFTAKGAGICTFWDVDADFAPVGGICTGAGTTVHMGSATAITVKWVKNWANTEAQHRIHGNNQGVTSGGALTKINAATACEDDGFLTHSQQCGTPAAGANTDESGLGNATVFQRTIHPSVPTANTVVVYYDHLTGTGGGAPSDLPGKITLMP